MNKEILSEIYSYKYEGNYLNNYSKLISVIKEVAENITNPNIQDIAIHLVIESRNHRWGMSYSKAFEMNIDLQTEIKNETEKLIEKLPTEIAPALSFMNREIPMYKGQLEKNTRGNWMFIAQPWEFYIKETKDTSELFVNDFNNNLNAEIVLDDRFNQKIKNDKKVPYELIYAKINEWKLKNWLKKAGEQQIKQNFFS